MSAVSRLMTLIRRACRRAARTISRHMGYFIVVSLFLAITGCATTSVSGITRGQTKEQVVELLGPPSKPCSRDFLGREYCVWSIPVDGNRVQKRLVAFTKDGKVKLATEFLAPAANPTPMATE